MRKRQDEYILEREIIDEKFHVRIFRPVLTEEERARRMKRLHKAAEELLKDAMRTKKGRSEGIG